MEEVNYPHVPFANRNFISSESEQVVHDFIKVYPNPAAEMLVIERKNLPIIEDSYYTIVDMNGKEVFRVSALLGSQQVLDISELASGVYHLSLIDMNQEILSLEFIKK